MKINPAKHHRQSIRLKDYDYSQPGSYFVTICTHNYKKLFGDIVTVGASSVRAGSVRAGSVRAGSVRAGSVRAGSEPAPTSQPDLHSLESSSTEYVKMNLNNYGEIVVYTWKDLVNHITGIKLGEFVIMPNHFHGIIHIIDLETEWDDFIPSNFIFHGVGAGSEPAPTDHQKQTPLSEIIRQFKTFSARRINQIRKTPEVPVWQRNYYEHIIRNQESYDQIVEYIQNNPVNWKIDKLFVD